MVDDWKGLRTAGLVSVGVAIGVSAGWAGLSESCGADEEYHNGGSLGSDAAVSLEDRTLIDSGIPGLKYEVNGGGDSKLVLDEKVFGDMLDKLTSDDVKKALVLRVVNARLTDDPKYLGVAFDYYMIGGNVREAREILTRIDDLEIVREHYRNWTDHCVGQHGDNLIPGDREFCPFEVCASLAEDAEDDERAAHYAAEAGQEDMSRVYGNLDRLLRKISTPSCDPCDMLGEVLGIQGVKVITLDTRQ